MHLNFPLSLIETWIIKLSICLQPIYAEFGKSITLISSGLNQTQLSSWSQIPLYQIPALRDIVLLPLLHMSSTSSALSMPAGIEVLLKYRCPSSLGASGFLCLACSSS